MRWPLFALAFALSTGWFAPTQAATRPDWCPPYAPHGYFWLTDGVPNYCAPTSLALAERYGNVALLYGYPNVGLWREGTAPPVLCPRTPFVRFRGTQLGAFAIIGTAFPSGRAQSLTAAWSAATTKFKHGAANVTVYRWGTPMPTFCINVLRAVGERAFRQAVRAAVLRF